MHPANDQARERLDGVFDDIDLAIQRVPGKRVLKQLSRWANDEYSRGITMRDIVKEIRTEEIPNEVFNVLRAIESRKTFQ